MDSRCVSDTVYICKKTPVSVGFYCLDGCNFERWLKILWVEGTSGRKNGIGNSNGSVPKNKPLTALLTARRRGQNSGSQWAARALTTREKASYLVDPASSYMLVSKIKPCMSKYKRTYIVKLQMAH